MVMARATTTRKRKTTTTTKSKSARKPAAPKAAPVVVQEKAPVVSAPDLKKIDLVDEVVARSGVKKKFAKPAIEAALAVLGEALAEGRDLNLRPLGKVKIQKTKELANGTVITTRIRQPQVKKVEDEGVADAAE
jgi:DNA-binding protein HU-alpha